MQEYVHIGKIVATFGTQGELLLSHKLGTSSGLKIDTLFLEEKSNSLLPYFIESLRAKDDSSVYIKLEGIDSREKAFPLLRHAAYLAENDFQKNVNHHAPLALIGFSMHDEQHGMIGTVSEVLEMPAQTLVKLDYHGREALIPLNEHTLQKIDRKKKCLYMKLPEGLLEIY